MPKLYSYVLRFDDGTAPNPFWGTCTLTICKPAIRSTAQMGDWVIGTGSKNAKLSDGIRADFSHCIVYAMKVTDKKSFREYDSYCRQQCTNKIPDQHSPDWRIRMGDCIYDYQSGPQPIPRKGSEHEAHLEKDMKSHHALLSDQFYYFGEAAIPLPIDLMGIIKRNQGHRVITQPETVAKFEHWIKQFNRNKIHGNPQMCWKFQNDDACR